MSVVVSVCLITYNHEKFIAEAIEGVLAQKANFNFEIVIGEDFSTDNTYAICKSYADRYPGVIRLLPSDRNHGSIPNFMRTISACYGKYIALSDGDDYWTDPNKLQNDVDFLEVNSDFNLCFSGVEVLDELGWDKERLFPELKKDIFTIEDLILSGVNFLPTTTTMLRNIFPRPLPDFFRNVLSFDNCIQLLTFQDKKAKYFPNKTAVYRNHSAGISKTESHMRESDDALMKLLEEIDKFYDYKYTASVKKRLLEMSKVNLIYGARNKKGLDKVRHYFRRMPDYIKYSKKISLKEFLYYHAILFFPFLLRRYAGNKYKKINA